MSNRQLTRDLLLEYNLDFIPPRPRAAGLRLSYEWVNDHFVSNSAEIPADPNQTVVPSVYPWENYNMSILVEQLYTIAAGSGFTGTINEFKTYFGYYLERSRPEIIFDKFTNFPETGNSTQLFFDLDTNILYYWDNEYIPVNAMLIANTMLNGGEA